MKNTIINYDGKSFKKVIVSGKQEVLNRCGNCYFKGENNTCLAPKICKACEGDHKTGFYWELIDNK